MVEVFLNRGYKVVSGGTENHLFRAVKRANGRIHRLTVHDHDMAFLVAHIPGET